MASLAKLSSKNQITLPANVIRGFPGVEYFNVGLEGDVIVLKPLRFQDGVSALDEARAHFKKSGFDENTIADAVKWARKASK